MLDYLIDSLITRFSWQAAKASHAVLLCCMEQGEVVGWSDTEKIDWIRRANAQRLVAPTQGSTTSQKLRKNRSGQKSLACVYYNDNSCNFQKHHETKGVFYRDICSSCFAQDVKISVHSTLDCKSKNLKKVTLGMVDKVKWQPDCVQKDDSIWCKNKNCCDRNVFNSSF